ncbi:LysR family transcriptional regulator [Phaeobacter italicus]|uniref:LysR family transcriptional regulator n=1 Tax=Phaeobacter italicus TaxID=481446 RepID=UPI00248EC4EC|nr:LysR family transcriptional regulator [Phaeobacter italicus]
MLDALTLDQMRTFVAIADSGSFRAAAQSLSRVQSGVSVAIANLEAQLGVELFDRSGHRPVLTRQGQMLLGSARDILLRVDVLRAKARGFAAGVETELGIAVDTLYPLQKVGTAISQMRDSFPSVSVRVQVEPLGGPLEALRQKSSALAVMVGADFRDPSIKLDALDRAEDRSAAEKRNSGSRWWLQSIHLPRTRVPGHWKPWTLQTIFRLS